MSWHPTAASGPGTSPLRSTVFGIGRLLVVLQGLVWLGFWVVSAGNYSVAARVFGVDFGQRLNALTTTQVILGGVGILVLTIILAYAVQFVGARLVVVLALIAGGVALAVIPNPVRVQPGTVACYFMAALVSLFLFLSTVLRG